MDLLQGALLTGAAATGLVVAERVRHRGSAEDVREDITEFGTNVAEQAGKVAGFLGHAGSRVLGGTANLAEGMGDRTTDLVTAAGRTVARGAGATMGVYAGAIDRVVPRFGDRDEAAPKASTAERSTRSSTAKRQTARAKKN
jgi:hypothetical protein